MILSFRVDTCPLEQVLAKDRPSLLRRADRAEISHQAVRGHEFARPSRVTVSAGDQGQVGPELDQVRNGPLNGQGRQVTRG